MRAHLQDPGASRGYAHVGPPGAGHYVKMIHNGIEYGMLQAYAEGYEILHGSKDFELDLHQISAVWNRGSVVRSWLNELAERAFANDAELAALKGYVEDSGEGRWTVQEAIDLDVPAPVITLSLLTRFRSRQSDSFGAKVIAALRNEFGGHAVKAHDGPRLVSVAIPEARAHRRRPALRRAEPCTLIIFGAGDLLHRKLMPSLFHLMGDGLLPDDFPSSRWRARRWTTTPSEQVRDALKTFAPDGGGLDPGPGAGSRRTCTISRVSWTTRLPTRRCAAAGRNRRQAARRTRATLLSRHPPEPLRRDHQPAGRIGHRPAGARPQATALGPDHHREALRPEPGERGRAERVRPSRLRRASGLPHRPLPGQGDGPEPPGLPVRQLDLRAGVEPPARPPRADHGGGERGGRASGQVLRGSGSGARHVSEPPVAAAHADGDGAAGHLQRRRRARREGQGAPRHPAGHSRP